MDLETSVLYDQSTSFWLREAIRATKKRDPVDVLKDVELLRAIAEHRASNVTVPKEARLRFVK